MMLDHIVSGFIPLYIKCQKRKRARVLASCQRVGAIMDVFDIGVSVIVIIPLLLSTEVKVLVNTFIRRLVPVLFLILPAQRLYRLTFSGKVVENDKALYLL